MASERRSSGRDRKKIDYAQFGGDSGVVDDDDFETSTPPPPKKSKSERKTKTVDKVRDKTVKSNPPPQQNITVVDIEANPAAKKRTSLEEKVFERELQIVLEMSKSDAVPPKPKRDEDETSSDSVVLMDNEDTKEKNVVEKKPSSLPITNCSIAKVDIIEELSDSSPVEKTPKHAGRRIAAKRTILSSDSEYDDDDDGDDDDDDSDFSEEEIKPKKSSKTTAKPAKKTTSAKQSSSSKSGLNGTLANNQAITNKSTDKKFTSVMPTIGKSTTKKPDGKLDTPCKINATSNVNFTSKVQTTPSVSNGISKPGLTKSRAWNPPTPKSSTTPKISPSPGSNSISSAFSPSNLRLGLSRRASIKPLHPNARSTT